MERIVTVLRVKDNGNFLLHPMGTFQGYGGYVSINPHRELPSDSDAGSLGTTAAELLQLSHSTGYRLRDIDQYRQDTSDEETALVRSRYFDRIRSTDDTDRRFVQAEVSLNPKQTSWRVTRFAFDESRGTLRPDQKARVKLADGPEALGRTLLELLRTD